MTQGTVDWHWGTLRECFDEHAGKRVPSLWVDSVLRRLAVHLLESGRLTPEDLHWMYDRTYGSSTDA